MDGGTPIKLQAGQFYHLFLEHSQPHIIRADKPVAVAQFVRGVCQDDQLPHIPVGEPAMVHIPSTDQFMLKEAYFNTFQYSGDTTNAVYMQWYFNMAIIIVKASAGASEVMVDGVSYRNKLIPFPNKAGYSYVLAPLTLGSHSIKTDSVFCGIIYEMGIHEAYAYCLDGSYSNTSYNFQADAQCAGTAWQFMAKDARGTVASSEWNWDFGDGTTAEGATGNHIYDNPGTYTVSLTLKRPNELVADTIRKQIIVHPAPKAHVANDSLTVCTGDSLQLSAFGGVYYSWSPNDGLSSTTGANVLCSPTKPTLYTVSVRNEFGCESTASVFVDIGKLTAKAKDTSVCKGDSVQLSASGGTNCRWFPVDFLSDSTSPNPTAFPPTTMQYTVTVSSGNCNSSATITVSVLPKPTSAPTQTVSICPRDSVQISAQSNGIVSWNWLPKLGLSNSTISNPTASPDSTTIYTVEVRNEAGCSIIDTVVVTVANRIDIVAVADKTTLCFGEATQLQATGGTSYLWSPSDGLSDSTSSNPIATPIKTTNYTVSVRNGKCTGTSTISITINPKPKLILSNDTAICVGKPVELSAKGADYYLWSTGETTPNISVSPSKTTLFTVIGSNSNGCSDSAHVLVTVKNFDLVLVSLPDTSGAVGKEIQIPVAVHVLQENLPLFLSSLKFSVNFDARVLEYTGNHPKRTSGTSQTVDFELKNLTISDTNQTIDYLQVLCLISESGKTLLTANQPTTNTECLITASQSGSFVATNYCVGFGVQEFTPLSIEITPNPAGETMTITATLPDDSGTLKIYSALGQELYSQTLEGKGKHEIQLETTNFSSGMAIFTLQTANGEIKAEKVWVGK